MMTDLTTPLHGNRGDRRDRPSAPAGGAIAISREAGARGETIARRVGQRRGGEGGTPAARGCGRRRGGRVYTQELLESLCANDVPRQSVLADVPADAAGWVAA